MDCCEQPQHLIRTTSGLASLSAYASTQKTFKKSIHHLMTSFRGQERVELSKTLVRFGSSRLRQIGKVVGSLTDIQFQTLLEAFDVDSVPRIKKYLEILAIPPNITPKACQDWTQPSYETASTIIGPQPDTPDVAVFIDRMHATPNEIFHAIAADYFTTSFMPVPHKNGLYEFEGNFYNDANPQGLLALNRSLLTTYQRAFWEGNVWVIGAGHPRDTLRFMERLEDASMRIKKLRLAFTIDDICGASDMISTMIDLVADENGMLRLNNVELLERFASHCDDTSVELLSFWWSKFSAITYLQLDELTLDLRKAHGPDDIFKAGQYWIETLPPFRNGVPPTFTILAPTAELEAEVRQAFGVVNAPRL